MQIKRPDVVKVFGADAMQGNYLPVKFGTNVVVAKEDYENIANQNFEYGLESLEGDLQMKDLNTVFFYDSALLKYLFIHGIPEFSTYEDYPIGAVVQRNGEVWISTKEVKASTHKKVADPCDPCGCKADVCENPVYPSKDDGWCKFITSCEYDHKIKELEDKDAALQTAIDNLKGVEHFGILPNKETGALELNLELSDGSHLIIPMTKFGHIEQNKDGTLSITNANGTTLELPKFVAEKDLDQQKGFFFNAQSGKWEVDLADLVQNGSGLQVDKNGNISVKPTDLVDNDTLHVNAQSGKLELDPNFYRERIKKPVDDLRADMDKADKALDSRVTEIETNGAKVYANLPITGTGKKSDPLTFKFEDNDFEISQDGKIRLKAVTRDATENLNEKSVLGFSTFFGYVNKAGGKYVFGVPAHITSEENVQESTSDITQLRDGENYDFNGWQIASTAQVDQYITGANNVIWHRTNEYGMNLDGTLKNPAGWGQWNRETNVNITVQQIQQMQNDLTNLRNNLQSLSNLTNENKQELLGKITDIEGRLAVLKSNNDRLKNENASLSSQLNSARSQISSLQSQLTECKNSGGGTGGLTLVQLGKTKFNASILNQKSVHDGWEYVTLRVDDVSEGKAGRIEYVKYEAALTSEDGKSWISVPAGAQQPTEPSGETFLANNITVTTNLNGPRNNLGSDDFGQGVAWISVVPYKPANNSYGKAYYMVKVKYQGDPKEYPAGTVLDYVQGTWNSKPEDVKNSALPRPEHFDK